MHELAKLARLLFQVCMISLGWVLFDLPHGDLPFVVILTLEQQRKCTRSIQSSSSRTRRRRR